MSKIDNPLPRARPDGIPRRADLSLNTEAEMAIVDALRKVEALGADLLLTEAVTKLSDARGLVADWLEGGSRT